MLHLCYECPEGADCSTPGQVFSALSVLAGWWRPSNESLNFYQCLRASQCLGGVNSQCQDNHINPLCAICAENYYSDSRGECLSCPDPTWSIISFLLLVALVVILLLVQFWILLRSSDELLHEAKRKADKKREGMEYAEDYLSGGVADRKFDFHIAPPPPPSLIYKMKIALGFVQILTNLAFSVDIPWPSGYKEFISWLNVLNFDFVKISAVECIFPTYYFRKLLIISLTPLVLFVTVAILYLIPKFLGGFFRDDSEDARRRSRQRFWRMLLFTMFLIYPTVSSVVLRLYVCKNIEGVNYIVSDLRTTCDSQTYESYKTYGVFMIIVYPIGIPVFLLYMLFKYRHKLEDEGVLAQLGFLYDGYDHKLWFFELIDMMHKLFLVALLAFFPGDLQLPFALAIVTLYSCLILVMNPYIRKGDDRLHLLCQTEIYLLLLSVYVFKNDIPTDPVLDGILSTILICMAMLFFAYFVPQVVLILVKKCVLKWACCAKRMRRFRRVQKWLDDEKSRNDLLGQETVKEVQAAVASGEGTNIASGGAGRKRRGSDDGIRLQRNPLHDSLTSDGGMNNTRLDDIALTANPLVEHYQAPRMESQGIELTDLPVVTNTVIEHELPAPQPEAVAIEDVPEAVQVKEEVAKKKFKEEFAPKRPKPKVVADVTDDSEGPPQ